MSDTYQWGAIPEDAAKTEAAADVPPCSFCAKPGPYEWVDHAMPGGATRFCSDHWSGQLAEVKQSLLADPHFVWAPEGKKAASNRRRTKVNRGGPKTKQDQPSYGAKGNKNWEKRAAQ